MYYKRMYVQFSIRFDDHDDDDDNNNDSDDNEN